MRLTEEEQLMLNGERGPSVQKAMEIQVQLGEIYGAECMIPVKSAHMPGASIVVAGDGALKFIEEMGNHCEKFAAFTTLNTGAVDMDRPEEVGFSEEAVKKQQRLTCAYEKMGAIACHTCTPYFIGHVPKKGEHLAWGESSAIAFVNSVLGARTNREGGPAALAAAITGRVPAYGYHLDENRKGNFIINVRCELSDVSDFGSLGYWVGKRVESGVPVFTGIPADTDLDQLKMLSAALASSGSVALFHVVGLTPEAPTLEAAMGGNKAVEVYEFTKKEMDEANRQLNKHSGQPVSLVALGCPHSSLREIIRIAELLKDKKVKAHFWVLTSQPIKHLAERSGYAQIIEAAGAKLVVDTCTVLGEMAEPMRRTGMTAMATNSAKLAHYAPGQWNIPTYYGTTEQCVNAALKGVFENDQH
ncbi:MAG: aconitase X catalytic domain-containing protein [Synergistaceae bacterium]|nr:aconitase X catalytic domain-containing protein [Synergistaceae bacterium]